MRFLMLEFPLDDEGGVEVLVWARRQFNYESNTSKAVCTRISITPGIPKQWWTFGRSTPGRFGGADATPRSSIKRERSTAVSV